MGQVNRVFQPPTASPTFLTITPSDLPNGCRTIEVDNGSGLSVSVYCDGALQRVVSPYIARIIVNTGGSWGTIQFVTTGTPVSTDIINIVAFDTIVVPSSLPSFGPFSWGGGATPNHLVPVVPGDQFLAWQIDQIINLLTGVMTGQSIFLGGDNRTGGIAYPTTGDTLTFELDGLTALIYNFNWATNVYNDFLIDGNPLRLNADSLATVIVGGPLNVHSAFLATGIAIPTGADYNVGANDLIVLMEPGAVDRAVNLPAATGSGRLLWIKHWGVVSAGNAIITPNGADRIDGAGATITLTIDQVRLLCDVQPVNWAILGTV